MNKVLRPRFMAKRIDEHEAQRISNSVILNYSSSINRIRSKYSDITDINLKYVSLQDAIRGLVSMGFSLDDII